MKNSDNTIAPIANDRMSRLGLLQEPAGYVDGANLYEFVGGDPVRGVDPSGLDSQLPVGVNPPSGGTIAGPIVNSINELIAQEREQLALGAQNDPNLQAKLAELERKQQGYSCTIVVKSVTYLGSDNVVSFSIVNQASRVRDTLRSF